MEHKRGEETQRFFKIGGGGKLGQEVGTLKRRGEGWNPFTNYGLQITSYFLELCGELNEIYLKQVAVQVSV